MIEIFSLIYLLIGVGLCVYCQMSRGNAGHWVKYPVLIFSWPMVVAHILMGGED